MGNHENITEPYGKDQENFVLTHPTFSNHTPPLPKPPTPMAIRNYRFLGVMLFFNALAHTFDQDLTSFLNLNIL